ncbi:spore protease YyaC [Clostridium neonatale]|uniref:spore protease YyaC n=1 Tax=Clostridium neonatale TaxID=137838 RepID=UPI001D595FF3|nr:spore protease YyaC [Clostridium neonatale]CAG9714897.1 Spore protease YyaC [Clostridium neonatale]
MKKLVNEIKEHINTNSIIVCIGTDKCIGDCLGPLVGTILKENNFPLPVYGTLSEPIHALNIDERLNEIKKLHPNAHIIGIDACLGNEEDIGDIRVRNHAISPGKGVGKELPEVGETSIIGIVDTSEYSDLFFSRSIRLSFVMDMAKSISKILFDSCLINKKELVS